MGCNIMTNKNNLIRLCKTTDNEILVDKSGKIDGRGAYICKSTECLIKARKAHRFERVFKGPISDQIYNMLEKELMDIGER